MDHKGKQHFKPRGDLLCAKRVAILVTGNYLKPYPTNRFGFFFVLLEIFFYSFGDVTITGERLQILTDNDQRGLFNVPTALLIQSIR